MTQKDSAIMADGRKSRPTSGLSPSVITQKRTASHPLISSLPPPPPLHYQHKKKCESDKFEFAGLCVGRNSNSREIPFFWRDKVRGPFLNLSTTTKLLEENLSIINRMVSSVEYKSYSLHTLVSRLLHGDLDLWLSSNQRVNRCI